MVDVWFVYELEFSIMRDSRKFKKQSKEDWHWADIKAALEKAGLSLTYLSEKHGYENRCSLRKVKDRRWRPAEKIIADALKTTPQEIWPSRYPDPIKCTPKKQRRAV